MGGTGAEGPVPEVAAEKIGRDRRAFGKEGRDVDPWGHDHELDPLRHDLAGQREDRRAVVHEQGGNPAL